MIIHEIETDWGVSKIQWKISFDPLTNKGKIKFHNFIIWTFEMVQNDKWNILTTLDSLEDTGDTFDKIMEEFVRFKKLVAFQ